MKRKWFFGDGVLCIYPRRLNRLDQSVIRVTGGPVESNVERHYNVELRGANYSVIKRESFFSLRNAIKLAEEWADE